MPTLVYWWTACLCRRRHCRLMRMRMGGGRVVAVVVAVVEPLLRPQPLAYLHLPQLVIFSQQPTNSRCIVGTTYGPLPMVVWHYVGDPPAAPTTSLFVPAAPYATSNLFTATHQQQTYCWHNIWPSTNGSLALCGSRSANVLQANALFRTRLLYAS